MNYAQKSGGTNSPPQVATPPLAAQAPRSGGTGGEVTNLCFTGLHLTTNGVSLSIAWPTNLFADGATLDIFAVTGELTNRWEWICSESVQPPATNLDIDVSCPLLAPSATNLPSAAFFRVSDRATAATTMADADGDGLLNLHEFWADCDPLAYDGTNTAIYAAVHGVDDKLEGRIPSEALPIYVDYKDNVRTNIPPLAILNTNSWAASVLHGAFSLWTDAANGNYFMYTLNPISSYHVVLASHCANPLNANHMFMGRSGTWYMRRLVDKISIPNTDITIGIVNEALPTNDVKIVGILPADYQDYLGTLERLPVVQVNQEKESCVQEITQTVTSDNRWQEFLCARSPNSLRHPFGKSVIWHDSGSPCYLIIESKPVLLYAVHARSLNQINGSYAGHGYHTALFAEEIQAVMDMLSDANNLPRAGIEFFDFSEFIKLENRR